MPAYRKASIRELTSAAYELDSGVIEGYLHHNAEGGQWMVNDAELDEWLSGYDGQEIVLIAVSLEDDRPIASKVCRTCGREYIGIECPRCREIRVRLRGS
ncbi:MAG: hypothetical protein SWK90_15480 [Chloroflexota bacterium]|nr:hypothetical protein [Chloroflexota bacterium]